MKWRIVGMSTLALLTLGTTGIVYWSNQPAVTKVTQQQNVKGAETPDYSLKAYGNTDFTAQLPARFTNRTSTLGHGSPLLLQQLFSAPGGATSFADQLALQVGVLSSGAIKDLPDVQLRSRLPVYKALSFPWLNVANGAAFERTDQGYELDVFLTHTNRYTTIVLTGLNDKKDQLTHEMQLLVSSIQWR